jgi:hypothetical protein
LWDKLQFARPGENYFNELAGMQMSYSDLISELSRYIFTNAS